MHETSLGNTIRDYLSGEDIEETTYEEFRQALVRMLVEERGYPRERMRAKVDLCITIAGEEECRPVDFVLDGPDGRPLMLIFFCAGEVGSFEREVRLAARIFPDGPVPFALVTDTNTASLMCSGGDDCVARGIQAVPYYDDLVEMAAKVDRTPLSPERRAKEERIFHTYSGFVIGTCCTESCSLPPEKK